MFLLRQRDILKSLKAHKLRLTKSELQAFLDTKSDASESLNGVVIRKRGRDVDPPTRSGPHRARWYDIISPDFETERATDRIVKSILATR